MCVCPPGDGWYFLDLNFRIVRVVHKGLAGQVHAGSELGSGAGSARGLSFSVFLLAGVDTIRGPPHRMLLAGAVPVVLQKGA